jgi:glycosyltransferase involved in cell wall biosynthesis
MFYKIAIIVHGRFDAFDLARELTQRGHDVTLFTNYPAYAAARFGVPKQKVVSFLSHGVSSRVLSRLIPKRWGGKLEKVFNSIFAKWAAEQITRTRWDVVMAFSGVAEDTFKAVAGTGTLTCLARGSAHIREQWRLLHEEETRAGTWVEKPSDWIIAREEREYEMADLIHVLSTFAHNSFSAQGVPAAKLFKLQLGVNTKAFTATPAVLEERCQRILAGAPLRVLNVGTFTLRKGARYLADAIRCLHGKNFSFRFVGPCGKDAYHLRNLMRDRAEFVGKRPQGELPQEYSWGDVFILPTIEDGFAAVLTQALAAGLPLVASPNCAAPDLIEDGVSGWLVPIASAEALVDRLLWLDAHRLEIVRAIRHIAATFRELDWKVTGQQAHENLQIAMARKHGTDRRTGGVSPLIVGGITGLI